MCRKNDHECEWTGKWLDELRRREHAEDRIKTLEASHTALKKQMTEVEALRAVAEVAQEFVARPREDGMQYIEWEYETRDFSKALDALRGKDLRQAFAEDFPTWRGKVVTDE